MQYIYNVRYLPVDTTLEIGRVNKLCENNVQFLQSCSPSTPKDFSNYSILSVQALRNITHRGELLVRHGIKYEFYGRGGI